jgi:hypothetical protein
VLNLYWILLPFSKPQVLYSLHFANVCWRIARPAYIVSFHVVALADVHPKMIVR